MPKGIPTSGKVVRWTDDEWEQLAETCCIIQSKNPGTSIQKIIESAQRKLVNDKKWDSSRIRKYVTDIDPLLPKMKAVYEKMFMDINDFEDLKLCIEGISETPTKDDIINSLTDEEFREKGIIGKALNLVTPEEVTSMIPVDALFY